MRGATRDRTLVPTYMRGNGKVGNSAQVSNGGEHGDNSDEAVVIEDDDDDEYIEPPRQTNKRKRETSARAPRQGPKQKRRNVEKEVFSPSANSRGSTNRMLVPWHRKLFLVIIFHRTLANISFKVMKPSLDCSFSPTIIVTRMESIFQCSLLLMVGLDEAMEWVLLHSR